MRVFSTILVTGGAGFIGSSFIRFLLSKESGFSGQIINIDCITYAGNLRNLVAIQKQYGGNRYHFIKADICDAIEVSNIFLKYKIDAVVHFAAETHVDRSIANPEMFAKTNVLGTFILLEAARKNWQGRDNFLFHHVSTDEVYGSLASYLPVKESAAYSPRSPYSASKASSNHFVMAYYHTYGLPVTMTISSNNYGPYQYPEKFIPLMVKNMLEGRALPVYGDGRNIRDWIYVDDHSRAIWAVINGAKEGEVYNVGGDNELENIVLLTMLIEIVSKEAGIEKSELQSQVRFIKDRPGHDRHYAIDCTKIKDDLGWKQKCSFEQGLKQTVCWYIKNKFWTTVPSKLN